MISKTPVLIFVAFFVSSFFLCKNSLMANDPPFIWNTESGNAGVASNWLVDGDPPSSPPGTGDEIRFDRETALGSEYTVTFSEPTNSYNQVSFGNDNLIFSLSPDSLFSVPSNVFSIGVSTGTTANLTLTGGEESSYSFRAFEIATANDSSASITVTGSHTTVDLANTTTLLGGTNAFGTLTVSGGAQVTTIRPFSIAVTSNHGDTGGGRLRIEGEGSEFLLSYNFQNRPLLVSRRGGGAGGFFEVYDGGYAEIGNTLDIGQDSSGLGHMHIRDAGSIVDSRRRTRVGSSGTGTALVELGGVFRMAMNPVVETASGATWDTEIAAVAGSGSITVRDTGSQWIDYYGHYIGGTSESAGGVGATWIRNGGILRVAEANREQTETNQDFLKVYGQGTLNIDQGSVMVQGSGLVVESGGRLRGQGSFTGNGVVSGNLEIGSFDANDFMGNDSGELSWTGNLQLNSGSLLALSVQTEEDHDLLQIVGDFLVTSGILQIYLNQVVNPSFANPITLVTWTGSSSIDFSSVEFLGEESDVQLFSDGNSFSLVPEPRLFTLLGGLLLLGFALARGRTK